MSWSIKNKMKAMGFGIVIVLLLVAWINFMSYKSVLSAIQISANQAKQLKITQNLETEQLRLVLAAWNLIIHKEDIDVIEQKVQFIKKNASALTKHIETFGQSVSGKQNKLLVSNITKNFVQLNQIIETDLVQLIEKSSIRMVEIRNEFATFHSRLTQDALALENELSAIVYTFQENANMAENQTEASLFFEGTESINFISKAISKLILVAVESILDKAKGAITPERAGAITRNIEFLDESVPYLSDFIKTDTDKQAIDSIQAKIDALKKVIQVDLVSLIENSAREEVEIKRSFKKIENNLTLSTADCAKYIDLAFNSFSKAAQTAEESLLKTQSTSLKQGLVVVIIAILIMIPFVTLFTLGIIRPVNRVKNGLKELAQGEGDLTTRLDVKRQDEIGQLATQFNAFIERLHQMISDISEDVETLSASSTEMANAADQMSDSASHTLERANSLSMASNEMSSNMNSVAAAMEQSSSNVNTVASAAEEMNSTINEIARNAEKARSITRNAVSKANDSSDIMNELSGSANEIGKVVETITDISEQVNLLSLNATIEAARAGEAGKGFAVVANEIKTLAKQTSNASMDIKQKINNIQENSTGSLSSMEEISTVISDVNDIVSTIATAVEEQSSATSEISQNISQASSGIEEVNVNVNQSSSVAAEITKDISSVNQSSAEIESRSSKVKLSAKKLSQLADRLDEMVGRFKINA